MSRREQDLLTHMNAQLRAKEKAMNTDPKAPEYPWITRRPSDETRPVELADDTIVEVEFERGVKGIRSAGFFSWHAGHKSIRRYRYVSRPLADGWKPWAGGDSPVGAGDDHEAKLKSGAILRCRAGNLLRWQHIGNSGDIIAYRITKPAEEAAPTPDADGWIPHDGGPMPSFPKGTRVWVRHSGTGIYSGSNGTADAYPFGEDPAHLSSWEPGNGYSFYITAYKIASQPKAEEPKANPENDGWIEWHATDVAKCPLPDGTKFSVRLRNGAESGDRGFTAPSLFWDERDYGTIAAYKIIEPAPVKSEDGWIEYRACDKLPADDVVVEVELRDGTKWTGGDADRVDSWVWEITEHPGDIVRYRVVESKAEPIDAEFKEEVAEPVDQAPEQPPEEPDSSGMTGVEISLINMIRDIDSDLAELFESLDGPVHTERGLIFLDPAHLEHARAHFRAGLDALYLAAAKG